MLRCENCHVLITQQQADEAHEICPFANTYCPQCSQAMLDAATAYNEPDYVRDFPTTTDTK